MEGISSAELKKQVKDLQTQVTALQQEASEQFPYLHHRLDRQAETRDALVEGLQEQIRELEEQTADGRNLGRNLHADHADLRPRLLRLEEEVMGDDGLSDRVEELRGRGSSSVGTSLGEWEREFKDGLGECLMIGNMVLVPWYGRLVRAQIITKQSKSNGQEKWVFVQLEGDKGSKRLRPDHCVKVVDD